LPTSSSVILLYEYAVRRWFPSSSSSRSHTETANMPTTYEANRKMKRV
jgi:hypothetical protein